MKNCSIENFFLLFNKKAENDRYFSKVSKKCDLIRNGSVSAPKFHKERIKSDVGETHCRTTKIF